MLKTLALCAISSLATAGATINAISSTKAIDDRCQSLGYRYCLIENDVSRPTTFDPKVQRELSRFVRQVSRDKL